MDITDIGNSGDDYREDNVIVIFGVAVIARRGSPATSMKLQYFHHKSCLVIRLSVSHLLVAIVLLALKSLSLLRVCIASSYS